LDTLAAAYAEAGDFGKALTTLEDALRQAQAQNAGELLPGLRKARQLYRAGTPFRDGP
jgi:hypothetical protein